MLGLILFEIIKQIKSSGLNRQFLDLQRRHFESIRKLSSSNSTNQLHLNRLTNEYQNGRKFRYIVFVLGVIIISLKLNITLKS